MQKKLLLGLTLTTCLTAPAAAETWYEVGTTDTEIGYADADSIQSNGGNVLLTAFQGFETAQGDSSDIYYAKHRIEIDCSSRQLRELSIDTYDVARTFLGQANFDAGWMTIEPNTFGESYRQVACEGTRPGMAYSDAFAAADDYWEYMYYYGD